MPGVSLGPTSKTTVGTASVFGIAFIIEKPSKKGALSAPFLMRNYFFFPVKKRMMARMRTTPPTPAAI